METTTALDREAAEKAVLGAILVYEAVADDLLAAMTVLDFRRDAHRVIYKAAREVWKRGEPVNAITVFQELKDRYAEHVVGGLTYLAELARDAPHANEAMQYADQLMRAARIHVASQSTGRSRGGRRLYLCKYCGAEIVWVQLHSGQWLACDPGLQSIAAGEDGKARVVTGYRPHFLTCPAMDD